MTTQIIGSRKEKSLWTLDEVLMTPAEIAEHEKAGQRNVPTGDPAQTKTGGNAGTTASLNFQIEPDAIKRFEQVGLIPKDVIVLPGKNYPNYSYDALGVGMYRLGETEKVKQVAQALRINYTNTAQEQTSGRKYLGEMNWNNALKMNLSLGGFALPTREFVDFYNLLKDGKTGKAEVRNLEGDVVKKDKLAEVLDEISKVRNPYRSEWFDADFKFLDASGNVDKTKQGKFYMLRKHILKNGILISSDKVELVDANYISGSDCNVDSYSFTEYGLATKQGNDFTYWYPRKDNNSVARFDAISVGAIFNCVRYPSNSYSSLGVRFASPIGRASASKIGGQK